MHIPVPDLKSHCWPVEMHEQDENRFMNQQVWWIEPIFDYVPCDGNPGVVYTITNPMSGKAFDMKKRASKIAYNRSIA